MTLTEQQQNVLKETKEKIKVMQQVSKLEKEISTLRKKIEIKQIKLAELIVILDPKQKDKDYV